MSRFDPHGTVLGQLLAAKVRLESITDSLGVVRGHLSNARELAVEQKLPTDQIVWLQHELDGLEAIVKQQVGDLVGKLAQVEARSRG